MIFRLLDKIRTKPKAVRDQYAFFGAMGITSIVALFWVVSLSVQLDPSTPENVVERTQASGAFSQFWTEAKSNVAELMSSVQEVQQIVEDEGVENGIETAEEAIIDDEALEEVIPPPENTSSFIFSSTPSATATEEIAAPARPVIIETVSEQHDATPAVWE